MDSGNSESLQSSSDDYESSYTCPATTDHSSFFLPPSTFYAGPTTFSSSSNTYLNFSNNEILNQTHLLPPSLPPPPPPPLSSSSRNPRKRTRASRKPTTTVLTTDTSNFRAMVQEFTGVPASPFSLPFSSTTVRFRSPYHRPNPQMFSSPSSSFLNQYHHTNTSLNFPDLPLSHNHQVSTFQSLLSRQTTLYSLQDLDSMNLQALQQNQHPTADDDHDRHQLMMRQFSAEKRPEIHDNVASSSMPFINDSSGTVTTTTTTTTDDLWIFPTDPNI